MSNIVAEIQQEIKDILQEFGSIEDVSVSSVETRVSEAAGSWAQRLSESIFSDSASSKDASPVSVACPSCQRHSPRYRCRARNFTTVCGVLRIFRWEYKCQCGHIHVPWEAKQNLKGQYTPAVAAAIR